MQFMIKRIGNIKKNIRNKWSYKHEYNSIDYLTNISMKLLNQLQNYFLKNIPTTYKQNTVNVNIFKLIIILKIYFFYFVIILMILPEY